MKTDFQAKFLQHLNKKKKEEGFTLIELLVVIIIIGILAAIALPSFLNQAAKAKQAEGKNNCGAIVRAQQAYRLDEPEFAPDLTSLEIGIPEKGNHYKVEWVSATVEEAKVACVPITDTATLRGYGGLATVTSGQSLAGLCGEKEPGGAQCIPDSVDPTDGVQCGGDCEPVD